MGRPLNKKYFGNRNIGTTATTDNGIGGEGIASVTLGGTNNSSGFTAGATQISFAAPTVPGGVTATGALVVTDGIINGSTTYTTLTGTAITGDQGGTGLASTTNGEGTGATFTIAKTGAGTSYSGVTTITVVNGGQDYDVGDTITISGALLGGATPANDLTFTLATSVVDGRITGVTITEKGSGYVSAPVITVTTGTKGTLTLTAVRTTDSGSAGTATNQENAIVAYAWVNAKTVTTENDTLNNTAASGSSVIGDIVKQTNDRVYKVKTAQGTGRCILVAAAPAEPTVLGALGQMNIIATDYTGNTYYVTKLTSRKVVLTRKTQHNSDAWEFATGTSAKWKFGALVSDDTGYTVQLENA